MSARTDVHRPSVLVTEDYEYEFAEVNHLDDMPGWVARLGDYGLEMSRWIHATDRLGRGTHQCHHCGAALNYFAVLRHLPTGDAIVVGETCLENRFERASRDFHALRKIARLGRQAAARRAEATAFIDGIPGQFKRAMTPETDLTEFQFSDWALGVVTDIRRNLWKYGSLSEKQVALVLRLIDEAPKRLEERARQIAERALETEIPAPEGRAVIEGVVIKMDWRSTDFGETLKLTIKSKSDDNEVWLGWVTCPSAILNDVERGSRVRLTATWSPAEQGGNFAFGKRPSKAEILDEEDV